uniref:Uncharacterized protein n=1 Tax=Anopheles dirus TaxID=7168 RepID=A0A182NJI8_9DIPT
MSDTNLLHREATEKQLTPLSTPSERELRNAYRTWEPSWQTQRLASEANRALLVELVSFHAGGRTKCRPFEANQTASTGQHSPNRLSTIVLEFLVQNFAGGIEPAPATCCQVREFGNLLSTELPLLKIIDTESELFWRRVVWRYANDALAYYEHDFLTPHRLWKDRGVELKLARMIERQDPRYWELEGLEECMKKAAPFVRNLVVEQLMPYPEVEPIEDYESYTVRNAPSERCHHGSLTIIGHLANLTSVSLVFGVKRWLSPYQNRYSNCSSTDIENLGLGLQKLLNLKKFTLSHTRLDSEKLQILLDHLTPLPLETIRLRWCCLGADCGGALGRFLSRFGPSLRQLDLSNNRLGAPELDQLCPGLSVYRGVVDSLDLSYNPIGESGVLILGGAIKGRAHPSELNFAGCQMGVQGSFRVIQLLSFHVPLRRVSLNCVPISPEGAEKLVQVLRENGHIEDVQVRQCGLSDAMRARIRNILATNATRRDRSRSSVENLAPKTPERRKVKSPASMFVLERQVLPSGPSKGKERKLRTTNNTL